MAIYDYNGNVIPTGGSASIANDLDTNDPTKALGAPQGIVLKNMINADPPIPSGLTQYPYKGAKIDIANNHLFAVSTVKTLNQAHYWQGGDCFGNYLFMFSDYPTYAKCWVINMENGSEVAEISIGSSDMGDFPRCHANTVNFGHQYYDTNDPFPLIYVSVGSPVNGVSGILVYRIIVNQSNYSLSLVQTIKCDENSYTQFVVGENNDAYIVAGYNVVHHVAMPTLAAGSEVTIDFANDINTFNLQSSPVVPHQQKIFRNGKLLGVFGNGVANDGTGCYIVSIDLQTGVYDATVDLSLAGVTKEPEAIFVWDNKLCVILYGHKNIYAVYFA